MKIIVNVRPAKVWPKEAEGPRIVRVIRATMKIGLQDLKDGKRKVDEGKMYGMAAETFGDTFVMRDLWQLRCLCLLLAVTYSLWGPLLWRSEN